LACISIGDLQRVRHLPASDEGAAEHQVKHRAGERRIGFVLALASTKSNTSTNARGAAVSRLATAPTLIPTAGALAAAFFLLAARTYERDLQRVGTAQSEVDAPLPVAGESGAAA
jgi:hypothetical protein